MPETETKDTASLVKEFIEDADSKYVSKDDAVTRSDLELITKELGDIKASLEVKDNKVWATPRKRSATLKSFKSDEDAETFGMGLLVAIFDDNPHYCEKKGHITRDLRDRVAKRLVDRGLVEKAQIEGENALGGLFVMDQYINDIIDLREQYGVFPRFARTVSMTSDHVKRPRRVSGYTGYWVGELETLTESEARWDSVTLDAKRRGYLATISSELDEDGMIDFADNFAQEVAWAESLIIDQCGFIGDGTSTYGGIVGVVNKLTTVNGVDDGGGIVLASGNTFSEFTLADFHKVMGRIGRYAAGRARWFMHPTFYHEVAAKLQVAAGGNTVIDIANGGLPRFLGKPVELVEVLPSTDSNSQVAALYGDLSLASMFGTRRGLEIATSEHTKFVQDATQVRATTRWDINVHDVGTSTTAGPIVGLISAAS